MQQKIIKTLIVDEKRMDFLPSKLPKHYLRFEQLVYGYMDRFCKDYTGGYWEFYELDNNGFYIKLDSDEFFKVSNPNNYFDAEMGADATCIGVNLYALNYLACATCEDEIITLYYALLEHAKQHNNEREIFKFID